MKEVQSNNRFKNWAKDLYIHLEKSQKDIAITLDIDESTVRNWITAGKWDGIKESLLISKKTQLNRFYKLLEELSSKIKNEDGSLCTKNIDTITKVTAAINSLENEDSMCHIIEVAEQFTNWLMRKDIDFARQVALQFDAYIEQKLAD